MASSNHLRGGERSGTGDGANASSGARTLFISQINLHHCSTATIALNEWFAGSVRHTPPLPYGEGGKSKIALIQEPHYSINNTMGLSKELKIYKGRSEGKIRASIATTKDIDAWLLTQFSNEDQVAIAMKMEDSVIVFSSTYMPYDSMEPPPPKILSELCMYCTNKNWNLIVGADANSHNTVWGSSDTNDRGDKLLDFILSTNLHICNIGDAPTFSSATRDEVIDLTLASANIEHKVTNWKVSNEETFSDHKRIEFQVELKLTVMPMAYRNIRKTHWTSYREKLAENLQWNETEYTPEEITEKLTTSVMDAYHSNCKLVENKRIKKPTWWNKDLSILKREAMRLKQKYKRNPDEENKELKKIALRNYTNAIKKAKRQQWKNFCQEMLNLSDTKRICKILKTSGQAKLGTIKSKDGIHSDTPEKTLQFMLDAHFSEDVREGLPQLQERQPERDDRNTDEICKRIINKDALKAAFNSFQPYKAPGLDGIQPVLIQKALDLLESKLIFLYRENLRLGKIPKQWTKSKIVFIPKPGKVDYTDPKAFRALTLTTYPLKGQERMILWDILQTKEVERPLQENLFSYKEGRSTEDALHRVVHKIEKAVQTNKIAIGAFLDIDSAFNNATIKGMKNVLENKRIDKPVLNWIMNTLENRTAVEKIILLKKESTEGVHKEEFFPPTYGT